MPPTFSFKRSEDLPPPSNSEWCCGVRCCRGIGTEIVHDSQKFCCRHPCLSVARAYASGSAVLLQCSLVSPWALVMSTGNASTGLSRNAGQTCWRVTAVSAIRTRITFPLTDRPAQSNAGAAHARNRPACLARLLDSIANFVEHEIANPLATVSQNLQQALVDEVSQQDRIAGLHAVMNRVG